MIIPRSIVGLSTTLLPWLWLLKKIKRAVATSWRLDETYIKVKGEWVFLYRAVDKFGDTVDFMLSERRDEAAATAFFKHAIDANESI